MSDDSPELKCAKIIVGLLLFALAAFLHTVMISYRNLSNTASKTLEQCAPPVKPCGN